MKFFDESVLENAIDMHIHSGPDHMARYADCITLSQEAAKYKMRAYVAKAPLISTVAGAQAANLVVPEVLAVGSLTLNNPTGGLSPRAVVANARAGAKVIWLPTVDSAFSVLKDQQKHWIGHFVKTSSFGYPIEPLSVLDGEGRLKPEAQEILRLAKEMDLVLCSGHISPTECIALAEEAAAIGYRKFEITHANAWTEDFTLEVLKRLTACGATVSLSYGVCSPTHGRQDPREIVGIIREIGADHCILITDYGQTISPPPAVGMLVFYNLLKSLGVSREELDLMLKTKPAELLGLD